MTKQRPKRGADVPAAVDQSSHEHNTGDQRPDPVNQDEELTLAVMSDLHCHSHRDRPHESFLLAGDLRVGTQHPIETLKDCIAQHKLTAKALLVPGDLANKVSQEGMIEGWRCAVEIGASLSADLVIPVLGNHDVDSRRLDGARGGCPTDC